MRLLKPIASITAKNYKESDRLSEHLRKIQRPDDRIKSQHFDKRWKKQRKPQDENDE